MTTPNLFYLWLIVGTTLLALQFITLIFKHERILNQHRFKLSILYVIAPLLLTALATALLPLFERPQTLSYFLMYCFVVVMGLITVGAYFFMQSFYKPKKIASSPQIDTQSKQRQDSYKKLYWDKKKEAKALRERVEELESQLEVITDGPEGSEAEG